MSVSRPSFQFKASFSPCIVFEILHHELADIRKTLIETICKAPNVFIGSPVIIDFKSQAMIDIAEIKQLLQSQGMIPVGVRGGSQEQREAAEKVGLHTVNIGKNREQNSIKQTLAGAAHPVTAKLMTAPIRSGTQIYAKDTDLIVTSQVSPGAELMADGHIHVYGSLRGKALAGAHGNKEARIFCRSLEAELVAIAGRYLTRDDFPMGEKPQGMIQIFLHNDELHIEPL